MVHSTYMEPLNHIQNKHIEEESNDFLDILRMLLVALAIVIPIRAFVAQPFKVSGASMVPTFHDKEYLIVDEISYRFHDPKRGEVIIFHPPQNKATYYIKRIIGLPGETISSQDGKIVIKNKDNPTGFVLEEPYISNITSNFNEKVLGTEEYFVMGDNRPYSSDSRTWGILPKANIVGRAFLRLYPFQNISAFPGLHEVYTSEPISTN